MEVSSYIHPPFKIATSWSSGLGVKNVVELRTPDMSRGTRVFVVEFHYQFWSEDFGGELPGIVFAAISFPLNEVLESSPVPTTVEYLFHFPLCFSVDDYGQWVVCRFSPGIGSSRAGGSFTMLNTGWSCFIQCGSFKR